MRCDEMASSALCMAYLAIRVTACHKHRYASINFRSLWGTESVYASLDDRHGLFGLRRTSSRSAAGTAARTPLAAGGEAAGQAPRGARWCVAVCMCCESSLCMQPAFLSEPGTGCKTLISLLQAAEDVQRLEVCVSS